MKKILIIEDDVFLGDTLKTKLEKNGYEVTLSADGKMGFDSIYTVNPDLILLDIILPTMNGYEILEAKNADPKIKSIPVIVISNSGQPVEISRVVALGVKDYLIKAQFDPDDVLTAVKSYLQSVPATTSTSVGNIKGKTIMLVEDDTFLSDIISRKLSKEGARLLHARDGESAMEILTRERPDIILLDILLPGMDGYEILKWLKKDPLKKLIPVILLSNLGQQSDIDKGRELGAEKFLIKATVTLDEIINEILATLSKK